VLRDVALKRELAVWLDAKLTDIERRHNLDAKNAALLRAMAIKRLTKYKKSKKVIEKKCLHFKNTCMHKLSTQ
jgi:hypothetical protein